MTKRPAPVRRKAWAPADRRLRVPQVDRDYLVRTLLTLLETPSPSGYTDAIVHLMGDELDRLGIGFEVTRRGALRATLPGRRPAPGRAIVAHLDTIGAMVKELKPNGRLALTSIGTWSSRFAEGARASLFTDEHTLRGTIIPLKASGHVYNEAIDTQPVSWQQVELRIDARCASADELGSLGVSVGDYVAIDPQPEVLDNGFIVSRHLDDKGGVAAVLAAAKAVLDGKLELSLDCHLLFTIFEEVGSGGSAVLHQAVAEMVAVDNAPPAEGQNATEFDATVALKDSSGPFDYHLSHKLLDLANAYGIPHRRDVFTHYRCDAASAVEAGNDIRTALLCFGVDASHGYERTHIDSLVAVAQLIGIYMQSGPVVERDAVELGPIEGFPEQHL
jgi:peptidase M42 family hydrolase